MKLPSLKNFKNTKEKYLSFVAGSLILVTIISIIGYINPEYRKLATGIDIFIVSILTINWLIETKNYLLLVIMILIAVIII